MRSSRLYVNEPVKVHLASQPLGLDRPWMTCAADSPRMFVAPRALYRILAAALASDDAQQPQAWVGVTGLM